jgi:hypothetical protein
MGESNISLPRILTVAEGTNPITVGQCGIQGTTLGRVDLGLRQRQAKQTRSLPASLVLNLSQGRSCLTFPTISTRLLLPTTF